MKLFATLTKIIPIVIGSMSAVETIFRNKSGKSEDKKEAYIEAVMAALGVTESVTNKDMVNDEKFKKLIGKLGDAIVEVNNFIRDYKGA